MPLELLVIYGSVRRLVKGSRQPRFIVEECRSRGHHATLMIPP